MLVFQGVKHPQSFRTSNSFCFISWKLCVKFRTVPSMSSATTSGDSRKPCTKTRTSEFSGKSPEKRTLHRPQIRKEMGAQISLAACFLEVLIGTQLPGIRTKTKTVFFFGFSFSPPWLQQIALRNRSLWAPRILLFGVLTGYSTSTSYK